MKVILKPVAKVLYLALLSKTSMLVAMLPNRGALGRSGGWRNHKIAAVMTWGHIKLLWKPDEIIVGFGLNSDAEIGN